MSAAGVGAGACSATSGRTSSRHAATATTAARGDRSRWRRTQVPWQVNEVQRHLKGADYPMDGGQLADLARSNQAPDDFVEELSTVTRVDGPDKVMKELKGDLGPTSGR